MSESSHSDLITSPHRASGILLSMTLLRSKPFALTGSRVPRMHRGAKQKICHPVAGTCPPSSYLVSLIKHSLLSDRFEHSESFGNLKMTVNWTRCIIAACACVQCGPAQVRDATARFFDWPLPRTFSEPCSSQSSHREMQRAGVEGGWSSTLACKCTAAMYVWNLSNE